MTKSGSFIMIPSSGEKLIQLIQQRISGLDSPLFLLYGVALVFVIVYSSLLPKNIRIFVDSPLGRILSIGWIYLSIETLGWIYGLLTGIAFLMILQSSSSSFLEGFEVTEKPRIGKRWFVEKVLGEDPVMIATEKVITSPIQT
jgi:hypothetical protein